IPPAAVTALSQRALPREAWGSGVATYTVCFAAGQPIGPALAGAVADAAGTLFAGLLTAVAVLVACCAIAALQQEPCTLTRGSWRRARPARTAGRQGIAPDRSVRTDPTRHPSP